MPAVVLLTSKQIVKDMQIVYDLLKATEEFHPRTAPGPQKEKGKKENKSAGEGRIGKRCLPIGLTLELRSSLRFPVLLLRNLMDGDRSKFLMRLVMVDPSPAIITRSP